MPVPPAPRGGASDHGGPELWVDLSSGLLLSWEIRNMVPAPDHPCGRLRQQIGRECPPPFHGCRYHLLVLSGGRKRRMEQNWRGWAGVSPTPPHCILHSAASLFQSWEWRSKGRHTGRGEGLACRLRRQEVSGCPCTCCLQGPGWL